MKKIHKLFIRKNVMRYITFISPSSRASIPKGLVNHCFTINQPLIKKEHIGSTDCSADPVLLIR